MSFIYKTQDIDSQYQKILNTQKNLIKTNKYMRELEQKYQKYSRQRKARSSLPKKPVSEIKTHDWPIESSMFTNILKQKLETVFPARSNSHNFSSPSRNLSRPRTRNSEMPKMHSKGLMANASSAYNQMGEISISRKVRLGKKNSSDLPYSRLSLDNSLDCNEEEGREQHIIRIPRYF